MNIMVTGGCGFLGSTLVQMLKEQGHTVISYDRKVRENNEDGKLLYVQGDLLDLPLMIETIRKNKIERIIHTAAISHPAAAIEIPYQTVLTNALGTTNVFEAARLLGIKRVVNMSSEYAYGNNAHLGTVKEDIPLHPSGVYGATKVFTEKLAYGYMNLYGMEIPSLRPGWIYGQGQFMQCYMKTLIHNAINHIPTIEDEGSDYAFQYVHVTDVARACILACTSTTMKTFVYTITAGHKTTYQELIEQVRELYPDLQTNVGPGTFSVLDQYATFDITRAREELQYEPKIQLKQGLKEYAKWLTTHSF
jgi:nucleoside-diphosphate-sugar epimerase